MKKIKNIFINVKEKLKPYFKFIDKNKKFNTMEVVSIVIISIIFGMFTGGILMYGKGTLNLGIKKELNEFVNTYTEILNDYYTDIKEDGLLEAGISGMVNFLGDPYSVYMNKETSTAFNEKVSGEYIGIGTEIMMHEDGTIEIKKTYETGGAYKAGIKEGDILTKVNGEDIKDKSLNEIVSLVKGKAGTNVKITVLRDEKEIEFNVKRSNIDINSVYSEIIQYNDNKIGYMAIDIFAANTSEQFKKELTNLEKEKIDSLIIDVRGNSGGYLTTVTDILSLFLEKGKTVYQLKTKDKIEKIYDKTAEKRDYKVAILVNGGSASASEMLTAAMNESYGAYIVGTTTYGKSKVQKTQDLSNGSTIKYTFQEWLTPSGESVGDKGYEPEYSIPYEASSTENKYDSQLQKALDLLVEKKEN